MAHFMPEQLVDFSTYKTQILCLTVAQGVTNRCRLSWLTNSAIVYEPKCGGGGLWGLSQWVLYSYAYGAQINFDLTPYTILHTILHLLVPLLAKHATTINKIVYRLWMTSFGCLQGRSYIMYFRFYNITWSVLNVLLVSEAWQSSGQVKVDQNLKGQCHEIFYFRFFPWINFFPSPWVSH